MFCVYVYATSLGLCLSSQSAVFKSVAVLRFFLVPMFGDNDTQFIELLTFNILEASMKRTLSPSMSPTAGALKKAPKKSHFAKFEKTGFEGLKNALIAHEGFHVEDIAETSWIAHFPGFFTPSEEEFASVWNEHPVEYKTIKMFGKDVLIPRYQQAYGHAYAYSGTVSDSVPETPLIVDMKGRLNALLTSPMAAPQELFNMCLCNWYEPQHYIGPHSDDTRQLHLQSPIASISWGFPRTFVLTPKSKALAGAQTKHIVLQSGDLIVMGGSCQETHKHEVLKLKSSEPRGNRVNFTFRCFK